MLLVVGLGNPGKAYDRTRHNIGYRVLEALADHFGVSFKEEKRFEGAVARCSHEQMDAILLLPRTYMNLSGQSVRRVMDYYKIPSSSVLVVVDDIALDLGKLRLRAQGSAGGHNGLKSIESHMGTREYSRLRIGVGANMQGALTDHVLGKFTLEEEEKLKTTVQESLEVVKKWFTADTTEEVVKWMGHAKAPKKVLNKENNNEEKT